MSAIFGVIASSPSSSVKRTVSTLQSIYTKRYAFDRSHTEGGETWGMGAMEQWITGEAEQSPQPYRLDSIVVVADTMLDYRDQLINQLKLSREDEYADVELIAHSYRKWGIDCVQHLQGIFTFAIYDEMSDELFIVRDRLGERAICYTVQEGELAFSTTPKPLATHYSCEISESYMGQYAVSPLRLKNHNPYLTPWQGIQYLPPGHFLSYKDGRVQIEEYWMYTRPLERTFRSEDEYLKELDTILKDATATCMRTNGEVGIMLSGGLDSTTVAAYAEPLLAGQQKPLHSFTHVPLAEYEHSKELLGNERPLVEELISNYPSIQPNWMENRERNSFNTMDDWLHILEMPYGFFINAPWFLSIHEVAQQKGVRIMLNGKHGNFSISYGPLHVYYMQLWKSLKLKCLFGEMSSLRRQGHNIRTSFSRVTSPMLKTFVEIRRLNRFLQKHVQSTFADPLPHQVIYSHLLVSQTDMKKRLESTYKSGLLHERGVLSTMISLHFNCVTRDPLSDMKVIEFCGSLPSQYFASKGESKRLLRQLMKGRLPHNILDRNRAKGRQSADWEMRLSPDIKKIQDEVNRICKENRNRYYKKTFLHRVSLLGNLRDPWVMRSIFQAIVLERFKGGERK